MESLNFQNGQVIGKQELINWNNQLRESISAVISKLGSGGFQGRGVMIKDATSLDPDLLIEQGTNQVGGYNTIKINAGWGVGLIEEATSDPVIASYIENSLNGIPKMLNFLNNYAPFYTVDQDNISIPGISGTGLGDIKYVCVYPKFTVFEDGTCNISTSNQVTFSSNKIVSKLRDQTSNSPTKLRFFTDDSNEYNGGQVYEVVSILDDSNVTISGQFTSTESNLYVAIVGSYDLQNQALLSSAQNYNYGYIRGIVGFEDSINDSVEYGGFPVARLIFNADHTFTIDDIRDNYLFNFGSTLGFLRASNNLNDVADKPTARGFLDVYSTAQVDAKIPLLSKVVEIGDWDMDATAEIEVAHGITNAKKIRSVSVLIRNDVDTLYNPIEVSDAAGVVGGSAVNLNAPAGGSPGTTILLRRTTGGLFDSAFYTNTNYNRGWVTIWYLP